MQAEAAKLYLVTLGSSLRAAGNTSTAEIIEQVSVEYERRHWHEMSVCLLEAVKDPMVLEVAYELHSNVLVPVRADISPIAYVKLVRSVCFSPKSSLSKALELVEGATASLIAQGAKQGEYAAMCIRAQLLLEDTRPEDTLLASTPNSAPYTARKLLEEVEKFLQPLQMHEVEPVLLALLYKARGRDYELRKMYTKFYKNAFDIVTYAEKAEMAILESEMLSLSFKAMVAALLSEEIFNFGKLLNTRPFESALANSPEHRWGLQLMHLCNDGDVAGFEQFTKEHAHSLNSVSELAASAPALLKKARLMALLHLVFYTPFDQRTFTFLTIAQRCRVSEDEAEQLLLAALAQGIVKGKIDGLGKEVHITWVEPRVLSLTEVKELAAHVAAWRERALKVSSFVTEKSASIPK